MPHRYFSSFMITLILVTIGIATPIVSLKFLPAPFVWICLAWFIVVVYAVASSSKSYIKALWVNLAVILLTLGALEAYFYLAIVNHGKRFDYRYEGTYTQGYFDRNNDIVGYGPVKDIAVNSRRYYRDELIYNVTYTIDNNGLRIAPPYHQINLGCILFFGGSYTFGEGVNDDETMPYRVGIHSDGKYRIYNFGFHGYGPHQMLSALEHGMVKSIVECEPKYVIYQALPAHVARSAGDAAWGQHAPRYTINANGKVKFSGHFDKNLRGKVLQQLRNKSSIYAKLGFRKATEKDIKLYLGILTSTKEFIETHFQEAEFHTLLWTRNNELSDTILNGLVKQGIVVHDVHNMWPESNDEDNRKKYRLSPYDGHPNALAHNIVAQYVVDNIISKSDAKPRVKLHYPIGTWKVLVDTNMKIEPGEHVALGGRNGADKQPY